MTPSINQIELHTYFNQEEQRAFNKEYGIVTESWSPLGRGNSMLKDERIAETHGKAISQVILRWHVQLGAIPLPKASSKEHQLDNLNIFDFELSEDEMKIISGLSRKDGRTYNQYPRTYEEF